MKMSPWAWSAFINLYTEEIGDCFYLECSRVFWNKKEISEFVSNFRADADNTLQLHHFLMLFIKVFSFSNVKHTSFITRGRVKNETQMLQDKHKS